MFQQEFTPCGHPEEEYGRFIHLFLRQTPRCQSRVRGYRLVLEGLFLRNGILRGFVLLLVGKRGKDGAGSIHGHGGKVGYRKTTAVGVTKSNIPCKLMEKGER